MRKLLLIEAHAHVHGQDLAQSLQVSKTLTAFWVLVRWTQSGFGCPTFEGPTGWLGGMLKGQSSGLGLPHSRVEREGCTTETALLFLSVQISQVFAGHSVWNRLLLNFLRG